MGTERQGCPELQHGIEAAVRVGSSLLSKHAHKRTLVGDKPSTTANDLKHAGPPKAVSVRIRAGVPPGTQWRIAPSCIKVRRSVKPRLNML
jgi:hypothetical protein